MSATVELREVSKHFGAVVAVDRVSLDVRAGEFLTLLGPSGCGKTTLLRLIGGFEMPDAGAVLLGGREMTSVPPHRRDVNQVFQSYALFPHLSVRDNIAFGLRMQRLPRPEIEARVAEAVALVALEGCEERKPHQLSGGQRQRVGLARALAPRPAVLLLDEPMSALDARLRQTMQLELKRLQRRLGTTFILVTHDQEEALAMSDRIAVVNRGRIEQLGDVHEVYHRPATAFVAEFLGQANLVEAEFLGGEGDVARVRLEGGLELRLGAAVWPRGATHARVSIRPEKVQIGRTGFAATEAFEARVEEATFKGATTHLALRTATGTRLFALVKNESTTRLAIRAGETVSCAVAADDVVVIPAEEPR